MSFAYEQKALQIKQLLRDVRILERRIEMLQTVVISMSSADNPDYDLSIEVDQWQLDGMQQERTRIINRIGSIIKGLDDDGYFAGIQVHAERQFNPFQQVHRWLKEQGHEAIFARFYDVAAEEKFAYLFKNWVYGISQIPEETLVQISKWEWQDIIGDWWYLLTEHRTEEEGEDDSDV